ncbi:MAG: hypothetical protein GAK36_00015 [Pseudomonas sp.]|nr:MAG: hypothetical protein GAK36_00015 [Pseudomonas sp.]
MKADQPDALGGQNLSYTAKTTKGRIFSCTSHMTPGLLTEPPMLSNPSCSPVVVHSNTAGK